MKKILCLIIFFMLSLFGVKAADIKINELRNVTNSLQMTISVNSPTSEIEVNSRYSLIINLTNNSDVFEFNSCLSGRVNTDLLFGMSCEVTSGGGKDFSPRVEEDSPAGANQVVFCKPNSAKQFEFRLGEICKLKSAGTYKIVAKKLFYYGTNRVVVVSNPLLIKVVNRRKEGSPASP